MGIDNELITLLLLFDFCKAFDTVSPICLLAKLRSVWFSRTARLWIRSYLTDREQLIISKFNGPSSWLGPNLGVPYVSVIGPLLFCVYINDICDTLDKRRLQHILYADDQ